MTFLYHPAWRHHIALGMVTLLMLPSFSKGSTPPVQGKAETENAAESGIEEAPQPKFIWGILIKYAASKAFEMLSEWYAKKLFQGMEPPLKMSRDAAVSLPEAAMLAPTKKGEVPIVPNITDSAPTDPLIVANGKENYQGALLSLLVLQADGQSLKLRPISEGFKSGEKFRIRIGATFDGDLSIDNVDPQGNAVAQSLVHRQEYGQGTGLLQEVAAGKYAAIAESIALQHR
jgi:hypothetical protein